MTKRNALKVGNENIFSILFSFSSKPWPHILECKSGRVPARLYHRVMCEFVTFRTPYQWQKCLCYSDGAKHVCIHDSFMHIHGTQLCLSTHVLACVIDHAP